MHIVKIMGKLCRSITCLLIVGVDHTLGKMERCSPYNSIDIQGNKYKQTIQHTSSITSNNTATGKICYYLYVSIFYLTHLDNKD